MRLGLPLDTQVVPPFLRLREIKMTWDFCARREVGKGNLPRPLRSVLGEVCDILENKAHNWSPQGFLGLMGQQ